jgi:type I restriction enzyme S subunit
VLKSRRPIHSGFFRHYFKSFDFIQRLAIAVIGIRDGKQISFEDFREVQLPYPPLIEQERIASAIDTINREINILRRQLDALKTQKKGLMQKLLTGQVRVASGGR